MKEEKWLLKELLRFLKNKNCYTRWVYCANHYKDESVYTVERFFNLIIDEEHKNKINTYYFPRDIITKLAPFTWSFEFNVPNSDNFWLDISKEFDEYLKEKL